MFTYLVALAAWTTGNTGSFAIDMVPRQVGVGRTLLALVGVHIDVVSNWTGDARGARLLGHQGTGVTRSGNPAQNVGDRDGVDLHNIINKLPALR